MQRELEANYPDDQLSDDSIIAPGFTDDLSPIHPQRAGRELATDFRHPDTGAPYNPDFAAMARSAGVEGVSVDRPSDLADAVRAGVAAGRPYPIDATPAPAGV